MKIVPKWELNVLPYSVQYIESDHLSSCYIVEVQKKKKIYTKRITQQLLFFNYNSYGKKIIVKIQDDFSGKNINISSALLARYTLIHLILII